MTREEQLADNLKTAKELNAQIKAQIARYTATEVSRPALPVASPPEPSQGHADRVAFVDAQARADKVAQAFQDEAPRPMYGETPLEYRRRLARPFQQYSPTYKAIDLGIVPEQMFSNVEQTVYADALAYARHPTSVEKGTLRPIVTRNYAGTPVTEWVGHPDVAFAPFKMQLQTARLKWPAGFKW